MNGRISTQRAQSEDARVRKEDEWASPCLAIFATFLLKFSPCLRGGSSAGKMVLQKIGGRRQKRTGAHTLTFDPNGNFISNLTGLAFGYDYDNKATNVMMAGYTNRYEYDGLGDRIRRTVNGTTYIDVLDRGAALPNVLVEMNDSGEPVRYFIWGRGLIAQIETNGSVYYAHSDELGSTLALTDTNGAIVAEFTYAPYGEILDHTGTVDTPYTFVGGYGVWNEGSGLYQMKARYYSADVKRFVTVDPIGLMGGVNSYGYCANNPIMFIDPSGLCGVIDGSKYVRAYHDAIMSDRFTLGFWTDAYGWSVGQSPSGLPRDTVNLDQKITWVGVPVRGDQFGNRNAAYNLSKALGPLAAASFCFVAEGVTVSGNRKAGLPTPPSDTLASFNDNAIGIIWSVYDIIPGTPSPQDPPAPSAQSYPAVSQNRVGVTAWQR